MSKLILQKSRFFSPNPPEAAKNAGIRELRKSALRFFNG
jgi:hypothetical protein